MSKFGDIPTSNNPPLGSNPAVASKDCYHMFLVVILWQGDVISTDGAGVLRKQLPAAAKFILPHFGGSIAKFCFCESSDRIKKLKEALRTNFPASSNLKPQSIGNDAIVIGYELTARDCGCGLGSCTGNEEFEILGTNGQPLDITYHVGGWITSTGETRHTMSRSKKDILQDIIDTERGKPLPCCKEKSSSSSTSLGN